MAVIYVSDKDKLPAKIEHDFYPTPVGLVRDFFTQFPYHAEFKAPFILDPGAGGGNWGRGLSLAEPKVTYHLTGIEKRDVHNPHRNIYQDWIGNQDYLQYMLPFQYDIIMGNPPYSDRLAEKFIHRSFDLLLDGGYLIFLLKLSFMQTQTRYEEFFSRNWALRPAVVYVSVRRVNFTGGGNPDVYAIYVWKKVPDDLTGDPIIKWFDWSKE